MYEAYAGWGEESTWATEVARAQFARIHSASAMNHNIERPVFTHLQGRDPVSAGRFTNVQSGSATLAVPLVYDGVGKLLKHCFGDVTDSGAPSTYTHAHVTGHTVATSPYTRASSPLVGLSVEMHYAFPDTSVESRLLTGGRVTSFGFDYAQNQEDILTVELAGERVILEPKTTATYPDYSADLVLPSEVAVTIDAGTHIILGCTINVNNALDTERAPLGSAYVAAAQPTGKREVTGTLKVQYTATDGDALYDKFIAGTTAKLVVTSTGSGVNVMTTTIEDIRFTGMDVPMEEGELIDVDLPFVALYDGTNPIIKLDEVNATATT